MASPLRILRKPLFALATGLVAGALALAVQDHLSRLEYATWDWRVDRQARPGEATPQVHTILFDQGTLDWGYQNFDLSWPWSRETYGLLAAFLQRAGVRAAAFDVLYTEPSFYGVEDDQGFAQSLTGERPMVLAAALTRDAWARGGAFTPYPVDVRGEPPSGLVFPHLTAPVPALAEAARLGDVGATQDSDGTIRRAPPLRFLEDQPFPGLALALWMEGHPDRTVAWSPRKLRLGDTRIPLDAEGRAILRYRGGTQTHPAWSARSVINSELRLREGAEPEVDPEELRDAFVLVGFSAPGLMDVRSTPVARALPGVEIHATLLDNLLARDTLADVPPLVTTLGTLALAVAAAAAGLLARRAWHGFILAGAVVALPFVVGALTYRAGWWWPVAVHEVAGLVALLGGLVLNYATEGRQKQFLKGAFKHYLSPVVIDQILQHPERLRLGGERRRLTIFFSDLQGFSAISEKLDPEALTHLLNDYLTDMTDIILEEGGTLDKYEGDAIIAFWNAPLDQPDHADRACRAARRCQARLESRQAEFRERSGVDLRMRIGIHTGEVVVGNMGSRERFDYTVLGDAANLASRLEGANKAFGTYGMVSADTWDRLLDPAPGRPLARLRVVGRATPVQVHELRTEHLPDSLAARWAEAQKALAARDLDAARRAFEACGDDPPARAYLAYLDRLGPQAEVWDGVWELTSK